MRATPLYVGIRVKNMDESIDFYVNVLGMKARGRQKIASTKGEVAGLKSDEGGFEIELNYYEKDSPYYTEYFAGEGLDHLAFKIEDLDKALNEAKSLGYKTRAEVRSDNSRWAYIEDPNGIWIELTA